MWLREADRNGLINCCIAFLFGLLALASGFLLLFSLVDPESKVEMDHDLMDFVIFRLVFVGVTLASFATARFFWKKI